MLTLYDKLKMVEKRIKDKSFEREILYNKIIEENISAEDQPDHEYFVQIEFFRKTINILMYERNVLLDTIQNDIIGKEG